MTTRTLLGLSGYARSGKDTVADILFDHGFKRLAFADTLREAIYRLNPTVFLQNDDWAGFVPLQEVVDTFGWEQAKKVTPEVRDLLQRLGTEVGRDMFGTNFWVDQTFRKLESDPGQRFVLTDVRFPNEADAVRDAGGFVLRVRREGFGPVNGHSSETALDGYEFDAFIDNDGTIPELATQVAELVDHLQHVLYYQGAARV